VRILLDYRPALRQRTGVGQYVHELGTALQSHLSPADSLTLFSSSWKDRLPATVVPAAGRVDLRIPVRALNLAWHRLEWPPAEIFAGPIEIAHSAHPLLMPARRALQVVTIYDLDFLDHPERTRAEVRRDYPVLAEQHARRADLVVVISEYTSQMVQARFGIARDRIVVCHPGAPPSSPVRSRSGQAGPILFVGTLEPRKNLPALFAAYERVVARQPDAPPLVLAGKQVEQSARILATLDATPFLKDRVRQLGYVPDADREKLYEEASMLVLPSLDEGFGMTAVEAMQAGVPVVASRRGALPEVVGDAGLLVDPADESELADAIASLLGSPELRLHYSEAGRLRARKFSWSASAARLLDAYRNALANRNAGHPQ
jgi:glycosyltransferase involved in cell wall biosynthesis